MCGPVSLDELVFDDPVDFPRDRVQVLCVDRVQCPFPDPQHTPADRVRAAVSGEVAGLGEVLALDVARADLAAVTQPYPATPGQVAADVRDGLDRVVQGQVWHLGG